MRRSQDLPVDSPRRRVSGRGVLIVLGGLFLFVLIFGRAIARFYVDYLWHDALDRNDVFWGAIGAKVTLFVGFFLIFAVLAGVNLFVADRVAPESFPANVHPYVERFHDIFGRRLRLLRYGVATVFALMLAAPAIARWQDWLLFRNSQSFGTRDSQFDRDVGFYVFELPFLSFLLDWMFAAVIIVLLLTIAAHILNGGVTLVSPVPVVRAATKTHVAVLLALLAILKAGDYWLDRFELTNAQTGIVQGATYSVVEARLPALLLLILIAVFTAILYFSVAKTGSFRAPIIASALWLLVSIVGGVIYPAIIQGLVVNPDQESRESEFIARNVTATQQAYGLTQIDVREIEFNDDAVTTADVEADLDNIDNVRLLNPTSMRDRFVFDRSEVSELTINDLDVDRQVLDGEDEQVFVAALELDLGSVPNRSWQGLHLLNTRGCGMVLAPAGEVTAGIQRPVYQTVDLERPELYFDQSLTGYAITNSESNERECDEAHEYEGTNGVPLSSFIRKAAFSLAFLDYNLLLSGAIQDESQVLWVRGVNARLEKLAPFLSYDSDPYPVAMDDRVNWVIDAYTTTSRYPYSESIGDVALSSGTGLNRSANYVRNSVKVVVDGYSGEVDFYVVDTEDPILRAWRSVFPDLFTEEIPDELREHFRYPEDLFRVQTDRYSKYRIAPEQFFARTGAWSIAQAPAGQPTGDTSTGTPAETGALGSASSNTFATEAPTDRFTPYYTYFDTSLPGEERNEEFVLFRPFVEFSPDNSRTQLQAYMVASSDPDTYGQLTTYVVQPDDGQLPDGPLLVASDAESTRDISQRISRDSEGGTGVVFGDLQLVPVGEGLLYIRPYYVVQQRTGSRVSQTTEFRAVIASFNGRAVLADTITEALADLFPGFDGELDELAVVDPDDPDAVASDDDEVIDDDRTSDELLLDVNALLIEADAALADGDLGAYQDRVDEANELLQQALDALGIDTEPVVDEAADDEAGDDETTDDESAEDDSGDE